MRIVYTAAVLCMLTMSGTALAAAPGDASPAQNPSAPPADSKDASVTPPPSPAPAMTARPEPSVVQPRNGLSVTKLPNGLTVAIQKDSRFPLASLRLYVHAGSVYETPDQAGISHQLEHMVFKGTEKRPKGAIATDVEKAGGYLNAATSFDYTVYKTDMPEDQWALGMDVLKDMAFHPSLDPQELESEKKVVLAERQRGEDSPGSRLFEQIQAQVLRGTPYERPIIGFPETIKKFTSEAIRAYISTWYQPQSMLLVVVGNVDPDAVLAEATRLFGDIPNTRNLVPPFAPLTLSAAKPGHPTISVKKTPWNKVHLAVSFPGVAQNDARAPSLEVLAQLLGGDKTSYLYRTYKYKKRLVDSIAASSYSFERTGIFTISATLSPENLEPFWRAFSKDLAVMGTLRFDKAQLDRAKLNLTDDMYRQKETLSGYASKLGYFLFFGEGEISESNYLQQIDLTDQGVLTRLTDEIITPAGVNVTVLVPEKTPAPAREHQRNTVEPAKRTKRATTKTKTASTPDAGWLESTLRAAWPAPRAAGKTTDKADAGKQEIINLGRNRTLILLPDPTLPYTSVNMAFTGGDSLIAPDKQGLATLTAQVLTRGTKTLKAPQMEEYIMDRAASFGASAGRQTFTVSMRYPSRFSADMFGLLRGTLTGATLPEAEISRVKESQTAAIVSREDQPLGLAFRRIFPFLFGAHPYGFTSQGDAASVASLTRGDVTAFWTRQSEQPWVMAVCGDFDRNAVIAAAKTLPVPQKPAITPAEPVWGTDRNLTVNLPGRNQAHLLMIFPAPPQGSQDEAGMDLLQNILAGQSGLLFRDLRDKQGLGYTVTAFPWQTPLAGMLVFYIGTEPDKMQQAQNGFAEVVKKLHETLLPDDELTRGKNQMRGDYAREMQKISARSAEAADLAIMGRPLSAERDTIAKAQTLTAEDLQVLARKYLQTDKAYVVKVLP